MKDEFLNWCEWKLWEIEQQEEAIKERWNGIAFLATNDQKYFAKSILETLIIPDELQRAFLLRINNSTTGEAGMIIDELLEKQNEQIRAQNPVKMNEYYQKHE